MPFRQFAHGCYVFFILFGGFSLKFVILLCNLQHKLFFLVFVSFFSFSESHPVLKKHSETALLLSLCGVGCVVLHQWPSSLEERARSVDSVLDCRFSVRNTGCVNHTGEIRQAHMTNEAPTVG